ncbi:MAG TPA: GNAT family N-acetyltransferase, partial [Modestobacter sp.]|nr:GNAT family N-acetyltransferase [Modestobacter sp.]
VAPARGAPRQHEVVVVLSPAFPPYTVVDLPDDRRPPGWQVAVRADVEGGRVHAVEVMQPEAASLWYVELSEPDAGPPASTLVAFSDLRYAEGTLLDADRASRGDVTGARQVGALRWWPGTGLVHQLYVGAEHRRRGVGRKLVQAAFGLQLARGLPPLHGDGRRTDLGEEWRRSLPEAIAARLAPWSHRMAPMTPPA